MDILKKLTNSIISRVTSSEVTVNCWFCNENSRIHKSDQQSWVCSSCEQYNGFNKEGDYNREQKEQYFARNEKTKTYCSAPADSKGVKSLLCDQCSQNQVIKVRQLAAFTPFHEVDYDVEVDMYGDYLEQLYRLCPTCDDKVKVFLSSLNSSLLSQLDESQKHKLDRLRQRGEVAVNQSGQFSRQKGNQSLLSRLVLVKSSLCTLLLVLVNLRLMAGSLGTAAGGSVARSYLTELVSFLVTVMPGHLALDIRSSIAFTGAALCLCGLYLAGKHSYYLEDVIHLLLWLVTVVVLSVADIPISWNLCLNCCTLCVSVVCSLRGRLPRNLTFPSIKRKEVLKMTKPTDSVGDAVSSCDNSSVSTPRSSSPSLNSSLDGETSEPLTQCEAVRQNLESVSLGLGRKTGSSSSVWSLPLIVNPSIPSLSSSSSELAPDSSSSPHQGLPRRGVLTPSRLEFLLSDPYTSSKDLLSKLSPSPSPWSPMATLSPSAANSPKVLTTHPVLKSLLPQNQQNSGECDSTQGPFDSQEGDTRRPSPRMSMSADSLDVCRKKQGADPLILKPIALRRSSRIAMAGRRMKPWKLQKSQSFACSYDFNNRQAAGDFLVRQLKNNSDLRDLECSKNEHLFPKEPILKPTKIGTSSETTKQELRINRCSGLSDVSDDECWEVSKEAVQRNKVNIGKDFSWQWIFLGLVIGISITTNVFLLYGSKEQTP